MAVYNVPLNRREPVADHTMAFHFAKPAGFEFTAGQTMDITLVKPSETDKEGNIRTFTIACAPQDGELMITTRLRDTAFKRVLQTMPLGTEVQIEGPDGSFTLHDDAKRPAACLTGGIGITPFRSIIRDAVARKLTHPLWLFYSNNRPEDAAFLDELMTFDHQSTSVHLIATMTKMSESSRHWSGETRLIDREMIEQRLPIIGPIYYLAGPPGMVTAMRAMLDKAGVPDADIKYEEFSGY